MEEWQRENPLPNLGVCYDHAKSLGLLQRRILVDHLLQQLTVDPHRLQDLRRDLTARLGAVLIELRQVDAAEFSDSDLLVAHLRDDIGEGAWGLRLRLNQREAENQQRESGESQRPL